MSKPVVTAPEADLHILELDAWWRAHRDKAPNLFTEELADAFELIGNVPFVGTRVKKARIPQLRRFLMRATRYHVYYVEQKDQILVLAVWGSIRGSGPDL